MAPCLPEHGLTTVSGECVNLPTVGIPACDPLAGRFVEKPAFLRIAPLGFVDVSVFGNLTRLMVGWCLLVLAWMASWTLPVAGHALLGNDLPAAVLQWIGDGLP